MAETTAGEEPTYLYPYAIENRSFSVDKIREKIAPLRFSLAAKEIVKELKINSDDRILEIGSGLGLLGQEVKKIVRGNLQYFGVDIVFDSAKKSKNFISPLCADAINLPFPNESFNVVISTDVFEHILDPIKAIQETFRVLKPGGKAFLVIADPSEGRFSNVKDHHRRSEDFSDVKWWEELFNRCDFEIDPSSKKYRNRDWRKIFNLPFFVKLKDKPGFACAFNPIYRPGVYVLTKPESSSLE